MLPVSPPQAAGGGDSLLIDVGDTTTNQEKAIDANLPK